MHWRTGVDNKFSFLRVKSWCRQAHIFRRWEECCSFLLLLIKYTSGQLPRCFAGPSLLPLCLLLRPILIGRHNSRRNHLLQWPGSTCRSGNRSVHLEGNCPASGPFCSSRLILLLKWELWMILFSAEAILASSTSKFGIWIPVTDDEDFKASTESTISTSLIHCIASVRNCEQVHTSVLNLIFQQANVAGVGNLLKWRAEICSRCWSATESSENQPSLETWLASLIPRWCLAFTHHMRWSVFWRIRDPWIQFLRTRCWWISIWICKKTFPDIPCVSQMLGGPSLRLGTPNKRLSIPSGIGWGEKNTGRMVTWECPLRTGSASLKPLESFIQFTSFCKYCILPVSSKIVSLSSTHLRLAIVSKVELWNFCSSSFSLRLFWWASRNSEFCCNNRSWRILDLVVEVLQLECSDVLHFFCRNQPGIRVS